MTMTMTMTNVPLNINEYSDSVKYHLVSLHSSEPLHM